MGLEVSYGISDSLDYFMAGPDVKAEKVRRANALCVPVIDDLDMALAGTLDFDHRPKPLVTWRAAIGLWVGVGLLWLFIQAIS